MNGQNENKLPVEAASESCAGLGAAISLDDLSLREFEAREYFRSLGARNVNGLTREERIEFQLEYNRAKAELAKEVRELGSAINNYA
jgi:hypothetical protein